MEQALDMMNELKNIINSLFHNSPRKLYVIYIFSLSSKFIDGNTVVDDW